VIEVTSSVLTPFAFYRIIRTSPPALEFIHNPIFSPDGTRIAFDAEAVGTGIRNVYILDLEQITVTNLTNNTSIDKYFRVVAWSEG